MAGAASVIQAIPDLGMCITRSLASDISGLFASESSFWGNLFGISTSAIRAKTVNTIDYFYFAALPLQLVASVFLIVSEPAFMIEEIPRAITSMVKAYNYYDLEQTFTTTTP